MILRTEIYATACIIGGIVHATAFYTFHMPLQQAMMLGMIITRHSAGGHPLAPQTARLYSRTLSRRPAGDAWQRRAGDLLDY